jgi:hypothetical protein
MCMLSLPMLHRKAVEKMQIITVSSLDDLRKHHCYFLIERSNINWYTKK